MTETADVKKRIELLLEVLQKAAEGDLEASSPVSDRNDEIDALAAGINMMIEEVKERTRELENRNEELKQFNKMAIGRELKMIELKKRIKELEGGHAQKP